MGKPGNITYGYVPGSRVIAGHTYLKSGPTKATWGSNVGFENYGPRFKPRPAPLQDCCYAPPQYNSGPGWLAGLGTLLGGLFSMVQQPQATVPYKPIIVEAPETKVEDTDEKDKKAVEVNIVSKDNLENIPAAPPGKAEGTTDSKSTEAEEITLDFQKPSPNKKYDPKTMEDMYGTRPNKDDPGNTQNHVKQYALLYDIPDGVTLAEVIRELCSENINKCAEKDVELTNNKIRLPKTLKINGKDVNLKSNPQQPKPAFYSLSESDTTQTTKGGAASNPENSQANSGTVECKLGDGTLARTEKIEPAGDGKFKVTWTENGKSEEITIAATDIKAAIEQRKKAWVDAHPAVEAHTEKNGQTYSLVAKDGNSILSNITTETIAKGAKEIYERLCNAGKSESIAKMTASDFIAHFQNTKTDPTSDNIETYIRGGMQK
ncbi:MAG: hypothetical protein LBK53_03320 [Heliobacteriaceae bacterium]|jgi:hypothetical protein|nr:hypothetical protein [Heliobacteriaceae bacterium]